MVSGPSVVAQKDMAPTSSRSIRVGIIGAGLRGVRFAGEAFSAHPNSEVVAIHDLDPARIAAARETLDVELGTTDIAEFLAHDIDAVAICSPGHVHAQHAITTLAAGKHVYLEKPVAPTIDECDQIARAAVAAQRVVMVGFELRYASLFQDLKAMIADGVVGRIVSGSVIDNVSVGAAYYFHGVRRRAEVVTSLVLEKGTHSLDLTNWLLDASPTRVYASGGLDVFGGTESATHRCRDCSRASSCGYYIDTTGLDPSTARTHTDDLCVFAQEVDVLDNAISLIDYDSGARIAYTECYFAPDYTREFSFIGEHGRISAHFDNDQQFTITVTNRGDGSTVVHRPERRVGGHGGSDLAIVDAFVQQVRNGQPVTPGLLGARDASAIAWGIEESVRRREPVDIPSADWAVGLDHAR